MVMGRERESSIPSSRKHNSIAASTVRYAPSQPLATKNGLPLDRELETDASNRIKLWLQYFFHQLPEVREHTGSHFQAKIGSRSQDKEDMGDSQADAGKAEQAHEAAGGLCVTGRPVLHKRPSASRMEELPFPNQGVP